MSRYLQAAIEIAREAGALLLDEFGKPAGFEYKGGSSFDLVTVADRRSEELIVERLRTLFPQHAIVAEEGGGRESKSDYRWFVDPLDGTTNFTRSTAFHSPWSAVTKPKWGWFTTPHGTRPSMPPGAKVRG
jgi:myo-inositol-1(or 4)-monophosphatase